MAWEQLSFQVALEFESHQATQGHDRDVQEYEHVRRHAQWAMRCPCGAALAKHKSLCDPCRTTRRQRVTREARKSYYYRNRDRILAAEKAARPQTGRMRGRPKRHVEICHAALDNTHALS